MQYLVRLFIRTFNECQITLRAHDMEMLTPRTEIKVWVGLWKHQTEPLRIYAQAVLTHFMISYSESFYVSTTNMELIKLGLTTWHNRGTLERRHTSPDDVGILPGIKSSECFYLHKAIGCLKNNFLTTAVWLCCHCN